MENKQTDFDVDYEETENSVFKKKKPKKIWVRGRNYFKISIYLGLFLVLFTLFFVYFTRDWFGISSQPKSLFSIIQGGDQYDCGDKSDDVISLKPTQDISEIEKTTKNLIVLNEQLKKERVELEREKTSVTDGLSLSLYKNKVEDYNDRLEKYKTDLASNQKEIDNYNNKVKEYSDFLKGNCTLVK